MRFIFQQRQNGATTVAPNHHQAQLLRSTTVAIYLAASTGALPQTGAPEDFESCKAIAADQARLDCFKKLLSNGGTGNAPIEEPGKGAWPLTRTPRPGGGADALSIIHTPDTTQSDPDLAGLMIRCGEKPGLEVVIGLIRPLPPRSKRDVVILSGAGQPILHAEIEPPGTALALPIDATTFTTGPWRELTQLSFRIVDDQGDIKGVIPLQGIGPAIAKLSANCPSGGAK